MEPPLEGVLPDPTTKHSNRGNRNKTIKPNKMKENYTRVEVADYLNKHYLLSYRKGSSDYYYNYLNRSYIPLDINKQKWTSQDLLDLFDEDGVTHKTGVEFQRFINHINKTS